MTVEATTRKAQQRAALLLHVSKGRVVRAWNYDSNHQDSEIAATAVDVGPGDLSVANALSTLLTPTDQRWVVWRTVTSEQTEPLSVSAMTELVARPARSDQLLHVGLTQAEYERVRSLGYVEIDDAALVPDSPPDRCSRQTWLVSPNFGIVHAQVVRHVGWGLRSTSESQPVSDLSSWIDFGLRANRAGILALAEPELAQWVDPEATSLGPCAVELQPVIERCFGQRWVVFWAFAQLLFDRRRFRSLVRLVRSLRGYLKLPRERRARFDGEIPPPFAAGSKSEIAGEAVGVNAGGANDVEQPGWMPTKNGVSVIIPSLGRESSLLALLKDLADQELRLAEVIVIEQCPEGATPYASLSDQFGSIAVHHERVDWIGAGRARNAGLRRAAGDWVLFLDDDVGLLPNFVSAMLSEARRRGVAALSATVVTPESRIESTSGGSNDGTGARSRSAVAEELERWRSRQAPGATGLTWAATSFAGTSLVLTRAAREIGGFDQRLDFGYGEDFEFGVRLRLAGWPVMTTQRVALVHYHAPVGGFRALQDLDWQGEEPKPSPYVLLSRERLTVEMQRGFLLVYVLRALSKARWQALWRWFPIWRRLRLALAWKERLRQRKQSDGVANG